jgi:hypothetical protein
MGLNPAGEPCAESRRHIADSVRDVHGFHGSGHHIPYMLPGTVWNRRWTPSRRRDHAVNGGCRLPLSARINLGDGVVKGRMECVSFLVGYEEGGGSEGGNEAIGFFDGTFREREGA